MFEARLGPRCGESQGCERWSCTRKGSSGLFNSSLDGNARRAVDIQESDKTDQAALKDPVRAAVALNLKGKSKPKRRRASQRAD